MPNWCQNIVTFEHDNIEEIKRMDDAFSRGELMQEFVPCPQELRDGVSPTATDIAETNIEKHGFPSWYEWCVANWGTKWDVGGVDSISTITDNSILLQFESAWSPPIEFYETMIDNGWRVKAFYYEPGVGFVGKWVDDENNENYDITGDSDWVLENIPEELDEMFQISDIMTYEEENSD